MTNEGRIAPFAPTRWTAVLRARGDSPEARAALSELCEAYYQPVFGFLRREGRNEDEARELTQEFFLRLLQRGQLHADPQKGRFRSYLLGAVKHFLADERKRSCRAKRGGGTHPESLEADSGHDRPHEEPATETNPDALFDREWALTIMARGLKSVEQEFHAANKSRQFELLRQWLAGDSGLMTQAEAARQLGWTETAVKVAIHRLRKRFRQAIRAEVAQTTVRPEDVDAELGYLVDVLSTNGVSS